MRLSRDLLEIDLYALIGVHETASYEEIRASYRRSARQSHPDIHPDDPAALRRMKKLNVAARILLDPAQRRAYDEARSASRDRRRGSWYERVSVGPSEWVSPEPMENVSDDASVDSEAPAEFRPRPARTALFVQDSLYAMSNERRLSLAALCLALGWSLISYAHPSNAFWLSRPGAHAAAP